MSDAQTDRVVEAHLEGVWPVNQTVGRYMIVRQSSSIINMDSISGQVGVSTGNAPDCASTGGVMALTRTLAVEWARFTIRVNAIAPVQFTTCRPQ